MKQPSAKRHVPPRKLHLLRRQVLENGTKTENDKRNAPAEPSRFHRQSAAQLRELAHALRHGTEAERAEIAGRLEAQAARLAQRPGRPTAIYIWNSPAVREPVSRAEAAERLGVTVASFAVMFSKAKLGKLCRLVNGEMVEIYRRNPTKS